MNVTITKRQIDEVIEELSKYQQRLESDYPENEKLKHIKTFKEFLIERKIGELIENLISHEVEFKIEVLVVENDNAYIFDNELLLEWEQYKQIPKTNLTYRYDRGQGRPGMQDHIHVYLGNTKNQVYAINKDGTPHDGSTTKLSNKEIRFLKSLGFVPPADGILEWISLPSDGSYVAYKRQLLFD